MVPHINIENKERHLKIRYLKTLLFRFLIFGLSLLAVIPLILILFDVMMKGIGAINWEFFTSLPKPVGEAGGGISNAIVGSIILITTATILAVPLGIASGIYLSENKRSKISYYMRICVDILQGTPSIVIGIIAYTWVVLPFGGFSALSGGVALGLMMLPSIIRTTEETLNMIPNSIKEAAIALGSPYYKTMLSVVLPTAIRGIMTGITISLSRVIGETAPILFTAFGNSFMNTNLFKPVNAMPLLIFNYAMSPYEEWQQIAWGASFFLICIILTLNLITKGVIKHESINHSD